MKPTFRSSRQRQLRWSEIKTPQIKATYFLTDNASRQCDEEQRPQIPHLKLSKKKKNTRQIQRKWYKKNLRETQNNVHAEERANVVWLLCWISAPPCGSPGRAVMWSSSGRKVVWCRWRQRAMTQAHAQWHVRAHARSSMGFKMNSSFNLNNPYFSSKTKSSLS